MNKYYNSRKWELLLDISDKMIYYIYILTNEINGGDKMVNVDKLRGKIVEKRMSIADLSKKIDIDKATFYRKINGEGETFSIREVDAIAKELNLTIDEAIAIFFSQFVA